jgi:hypothetical protein
MLKAGTPLMRAAEHLRETAALLRGNTSGHLQALREQFRELLEAPAFIVMKMAPDGHPLLRECHIDHALLDAMLVDARQLRSGAGPALTPESPGRLKCAPVAQAVGADKDALAASVAPPGPPVTTPAGPGDSMRDASGPFGIKLDDNDKVAYRGEKKAHFGSHVVEWKTFCFLIDQRARREWLPDVKKASGSQSNCPDQVYSRVRKIIRPLGLTVDAPRNKGARIEELSDGAAQKHGRGRPARARRASGKK